MTNENQPEGTTTGDAGADDGSARARGPATSCADVRRPFVSPMLAGGGGAAAAVRRPFVSPFVGKSGTSTSTTQAHKRVKVSSDASFVAKPSGYNNNSRVMIKTTTTTTTTGTSGGAGIDATTASSSRRCFVALYAKRKAGGGGKQRSAKTFMDGVVCVDGSTNVSTLLDMQGKRVAKANAGTIIEGTTTSIGNYEVEIMEPVSETDVESGAVFSRGGCAAPPREDVDETPRGVKMRSVLGAGAARPMVPVSAASAAPKVSIPETPLHSDVADGALILSTLDTDFHRRDVKTSCAVVVDPFIAKFLRPHQRDGVKFMYECVMGLRASVHTNKAHTGCLLAHEMGLGKTLQVIALVWTLLKQSPFKRGMPTVKRVIVCVPASLVGNWAGEFKKWLGDVRVEPKIVEGGDKLARTSFEEFGRAAQQRYNVLITSYETLRAQADVLVNANIDLLVCDEAHRLKNATSTTKGAQALGALKCRRRVLLTGTPIQNDLNEFFAVLDFACPGLMGDLASFRHIYAAPIERASERGASEDAKRVGNARREEIARLTEPFIHSRKADDINTALLPPKAEYVVFIRLNDAQEKAYTAELKQKITQSILGRCDSDATSTLAAIQNLQKLCNTTRLGAAAADARDDTASLVDSSSKFKVLSRMLRALPEDERIVIVSGFTTTLDFVAELCSEMGMDFARLQGSTPPNARSDIVRVFNKSGKILLLSTKAGGTGLNLVGACRLVLLDSSWNPADDAQAMARIWRDGQTKPVSIYRFLSTGTIEERMFQRQELKGSLARTLGFKSTSNASGGSKTGSSSFTQAELRDLFSYVKGTRCDTADRILAMSGDDIPREHWQNNAAETTSDALLSSAVEDDIISFVCQLPSASKCEEGESKSESE